MYTRKTLHRFALSALVGLSLTVGGMAQAYTAGSCNPVTKQKGYAFGYTAYSALQSSGQLASCPGAYQYPMVNYHVCNFAVYDGWKLVSAQYVAPCQ